MTPCGKPVAAVPVQVAPPSVELSTSVEESATSENIAMQFRVSAQDNVLGANVSRAARLDGIAAVTQLVPPSVVWRMVACDGAGGPAREMEPLVTQSSAETH